MSHKIKSLITILSTVILLFSYPFQHAFAQSDKPKITVTTTYLADIVEQIAPDTFEVVSIIPAGGDPHIYTATAGDLGNIMDADLVLFHGLHFEAQLAEVLESLPIAHSITSTIDPANLISISESGNEFDPHYWFDIDLYKQSVSQAEAILSESFPDYADRITQNTSNYQSELDELSSWVDKELEELPLEDRILVTPHDAFAYFAKDHDFTVYSPQGISTESEVSNDAIVNTVDFIIENQVPAIFLDTTSNPQSMEKLQEGVMQHGAQVTIVGGEDAELYSDSLAASGQANDNYLDMYRHNMSLIVKNLVR